MTDLHDHSCRLDCCRRCLYFEDAARKHKQAEEYYRAELVEAHALLGRVLHQTSERWDSINLTEYFPTDNLHHRRNLNDPTGKGAKS